MVKFFIALGLIVVLFITIVLTSKDVELNPKAKILLEQVHKLPNLDNNAYISLMALNYSGPDRYQQAKHDYLQVISQIENHSFNLYMKIPLLQLPESSKLKDVSLYGALYLSNEIEELQKNRDTYIQQLTQLNDAITQLHAINETSNFDALNPLAIQEEMNLLALFHGAGLEIFYLIEDKQFDLATRKLVNLIELEKRLSKNDNFNMLSTASIAMIFQPLIEHLYSQNFTDWDEIEARLTPLNMEYMSMNQAVKNLFLTNAQMVTMTFHGSLSQDSNFYQQQRVKTLLKPNRTINEMWLQTERQLIPNNINKAQLLKYRIKINKVVEQLKEDSKNSNSLANKVKNYDNTLGYFLQTTIGSFFVLDYRDLLSSDLTILLLRALIKSQSQPIEQVINSEEFLNPYTLEKPIFDDKQLCYQLDGNAICVNRA